MLVYCWDVVYNINPTSIGRVAFAVMKRTISSVIYVITFLRVASAYDVIYKITNAETVNPLTAGAAYIRVFILY